MQPNNIHHSPVAGDTDLEALIDQQVRDAPTRLHVRAVRQHILRS